MRYISNNGNHAVQTFDGVCFSQKPGHAVNPIQFRVAKHEWRQTVIVFRSKPSELTLIGQHQSWKVYNHSTQAIVDILEIHKSAIVDYAPGSSVLFIQADAEAGFAYHMSLSPIGPCSREQSMPEVEEN